MTLMVLESSGPAMGMSTNGFALGGADGAAAPDWRAGGNQHLAGRRRVLGGGSLRSRRPVVEPTRRTASMTSCLGVRGAASETVDDLQVAGRGGRRIGAGCGPLDRGPTPTSASCSPSGMRRSMTTVRTGGGGRWARGPRRPVAGRHRAHRGGCRRHDQRTACRCGRQWRASAGFRHPGDR